jgi:superfamily I DNA and/or RNA helicase
VFGSTVWQARKNPAHLAYDLVVIDEGSQLKVGEAAVAARRIRPDGRLVVAGDHRQLPPVIAGEYPHAEGEPPLSRSILECLVASDPDEEMLSALTENFRMCDVLCAYPAASIYPVDYRPFDADIAARRLTLSPAGSRSGSGDPGSDALTNAVLDPAYPLVLCILEDVKATAHNPIEAALVAQVVNALRDRLPVADDDEFHDEKLFVVSPHHAQIRAVRRSLRALRDWARLPQVDTVDKTQGQERDAVVVSYGVCDVEYALGEREFIYSLNRLNVAITRARAKSIVFLSRRLLEPPIQALDHHDVADGVAFMQGLAHWCQTHGPMVRELVANGERVTLLRAAG